MSKIIHHELSKLEKRLLHMCALAEESVLKAVRCCQSADKNLADEIIRQDVVLDQQEVFIEEESLKLLALYQPVAGDLRFIVAALKINSDLERVGDLAAGIAKSVQHMGEIPVAALSEMLNAMGSRVVSQLRASLDAFTRQDVAMARKVRADDDEVDDMNREVINQVSATLREFPESQETLISVLLVSRALERVGDHATNVAEEVIYMLEGEIVRHTDVR